MWQIIGCAIAVCVVFACIAVFKCKGGGSPKQDDAQVQGMSMSFANPTFKLQQPAGPDADDGELYVESEGVQPNYDEIAQGKAQQPSYEDVGQGQTGGQRTSVVENATYQGYPGAHPDTVAEKTASQAVEETRQVISFNLARTS